MEDRPRRPQPLPSSAPPERSAIQSALDVLESELASREEDWKALLEARDLELKKLRSARDALLAILGDEARVVRVANTADRGVGGRLSNVVRAIARKAMQDEGRPLNRAEILKRVQQAGVVLDSPKPGKYIGRVMWRSNEFQHVGDGYWLAGRPLPSATSEDVPSA